MTNSRRLVLVAAVLAAAMIAPVASIHAADGVKLSADGVTVLVPEQPFRGDKSPLPSGEGKGEGTWETIAAEKLPYATDRPPVLASTNIVAAIDGEKGTIAVYTRQGNRVTKRGEVSFSEPGRVGPDSSSGRFAKYKVVRDVKKKQPGAELYTAEGRLLSAVYLSADGILEFRPGEAKGVTVGGARLKYGIVPSFVGTDFVYTGKTAPKQPGSKSEATRPGSESGTAGRCYLPSMNLFVGLVEGEDAVMVGVWPRGRQVASLTAGTPGNASFDGLSLQAADSSLYLTFIEKPDIWHAEPLKPAYLEKATPIEWKRPLEAKWIGYFAVASEEISYPFYFRYSPVRLWGRFIRGWFNWPVWFDGDRAMIHFEKRFPPKGELLIYFLEKHPRQPAAGLLSPVEVMEKALGKREAASLLDFDGVEERPLLAHGNAVCAMTNGMQKWLDDGQEAQHVAQIELYCDDVAEFIRMIRERIQEFGAFAVAEKGFLQAQAKANPQLAGMAAELIQTLDDMEKTARNDLPRESLAEVRGWTDQMKRIALATGPGRNKLYEPLGAKCRSVAGTQDDLARALSILGIRLTEQAAHAGVASPAHAQLAEAVIAKTREVLRKPTWWEPRRQYWPKSDPGRP